MDGGEGMGLQWRRRVDGTGRRVWRAGPLNAGAQRKEQALQAYKNQAQQHKHLALIRLHPLQGRKLVIP